LEIGAAMPAGANSSRITSLGPASNIRLDFQLSGNGKLHSLICTHRRPREATIARGRPCNCLHQRLLTASKCLMYASPAVSIDTEILERGVFYGVLIARSRGSSFCPSSLLVHDLPCRTRLVYFDRFILPKQQTSLGSTSI